MSKVLTGKWKWNDVIYPMDVGDWDMEHYLWLKSGFKSNGQSFEGIRLTYGDFWKLEYDTGSGYVEAGAGHGDNYATSFEQYRVIDFGTGSEAGDDSDGTFVKWFLSNVTRYGTVADKFEQIAKNEKAVYQSGYDKALEKGGYNGGFEDGKQAEYDAFWDAFQRNGTRNNYIACFGGDNWNNGLLNPKYPIKPTSNGSYLFYYNSMGGDLVEYFDSIGKVLDLTNVGNANSAFQYSQFTRIGKIYHNDSNWYSTFYGCSKLVTIDEVGNSDENGDTKFSTNTFTGCSALINITIRGKITSNTDLKDSKQLSKASITNIINHLSDTASGNTLTLSRTAVDKAFAWTAPSPDGGNYEYGGLEEGGDNAWYPLVASKPNWQITLV